MASRWLSLFVLWVWSAGCGGEAPAASPPPEAVPPFALDTVYKGVSWVGGRQGLPEGALAEAREHGIEWIAQTPFGWMDNQHTPHIRLNRNAALWGEADHGLRTTTRQAHAFSMKVMLKPHLWLRRPIDNGWIGEIDFDTEEKWQQWEAEYRTFILHYARLAEEEGIEILAIATELTNPVKKRPAFWKTLAREIRQVYAGELTYAANWYQDFDRTDIWSELDYIGVNAYFPLTDQSNPSMEMLMAGWQPYIEQIEAVVRTYRKPVLLTEIGYKNCEGATIRPWEWPRHIEALKTDASEQVNAYEAMFRAFGQKDWFRGLFVWKWFPDDGWITPDRIGFSPQNKPAADVLKKWYTFRSTPVSNTPRSDRTRSRQEP